MALRPRRLRWHAPDEVTEDTNAVVAQVSAGASDDVVAAAGRRALRDATLHRVRSKSQQSPAPYAVGQRIRVSYDAGNPANADFVQETRSLVALGAFGLALALIAALMLWGLSNGGLRVS